MTKPPKKILRRLLLLTLIVALLAGGGIVLGRLFFHSPGAGLTVLPVENDKEEAVWKKANPWLYNQTEIEAFRETLILPVARTHAIGPRSLRKRGTTVEMTFPSGRPIHEYAFDVESRCAAAGIAVLEGREITGTMVEYRLKDTQGHLLTLKLVMGTAALAGSVRMALVITGLAAVSEPDLAALLKFPEAVTLVLPDTHAVLKRREALESGPTVFLELPMEPTNYPYVKPGPRALFIDYSRSQVEGVLAERLDAYPDARGFATVSGDRAIENPQLMESVLGFMAAHSLAFLDLTGSPLSQTPALSGKMRAVSFTSRVQVPGAEKNLEAELDRRMARAKKSGEGIWVLRYTPDLPVLLSRLFAQRTGVFNELGVEWVPVADLHRED